LYRSLIPYHTNKNDINERLDVDPDHNFNWEENNNHNYSDFIREFNIIHTFIYDYNDNDNSLLHPPDYNSKFSLYDENGDLNPDIRNIQEYYQNHRDSDMFYNPLRSDNLTNNFIQHPNIPLTPLEEFRELLRIQRRKKKKKNNKNNKINKKR
jgi:hypothetical protein